MPRARPIRNNNTLTANYRTGVCLRGGRVTPYRRARRFEPPYISAYRSDLQATAAKLTVQQQLCFIAPYRNLAPPIREKPRMMPRIAITQIARAGVW